MLADKIDNIVKQHEDEKKELRKEAEKLREREEECFKKFLMNCQIAHSLSYQGMMGKLFNEELWLEQKKEELQITMTNPEQLIPKCDHQEIAQQELSK